MKCPNCGPAVTTPWPNRFHLSVHALTLTVPAVVVTVSPSGLAAPDVLRDLGWSVAAVVVAAVGVLRPEGAGLAAGLRVDHSGPAPTGGAGDDAVRPAQGGPAGSAACGPGAARGGGAVGCLVG